MKKIYLAGSISQENRTTMVKVAKLLRENSYEVYCPWELKVENAWDLPQEEWAQQVYNADITAIKECDIFFMISQGRISSAGSNFEHGFACALGKPSIVIQITDESTSLMTFCGATQFINCNVDSLHRMVLFMINCVLPFPYRDSNNKCKTILT